MMKKLIVFLAVLCLATLASSQPVVTPPVFVPIGGLFPAMGRLQPRSTYPTGKAPNWTTGPAPTYPLGSAFPPGWTYNSWPEGSRIPPRPTQCGSTVPATGTTPTDANNLQSALDNCVGSCSVEPTAHCHVQLACGVFNFSETDSIVLSFHGVLNNYTLRGCGPGQGRAIPNNTSTVVNVSVCTASNCNILMSPNWASSTGGTPVMVQVNPNGVNSGIDTSPINLGTDASFPTANQQGSKTVVLASSPNATQLLELSVGRLQLISIQTAN